jgi:hypothetical protein
MRRFYFAEPATFLHRRHRQCSNNIHGIGQAATSDHFRQWRDGFAQKHAVFSRRYARQLWVPDPQSLASEVSAGSRLFKMPIMQHSFVLRHHKVALHRLQKADRNRQRL